MTKIIKVQSCWGCPLKKEKDVYQENYWCTIALRMFDIRECPELCVPDWCPLEDAPLTVPQNHLIYAQIANNL